MEGTRSFLPPLGVTIGLEMEGAARPSGRTPGGARAPVTSMPGARDPAGRTPRPPGGLELGALDPVSVVQRGTCPEFLGL